MARPAGRHATAKRNSAEQIGVIVVSTRLPEYYDNNAALELFNAAEMQPVETQFSTRSLSKKQRVNDERRRGAGVPGANSHLFLFSVLRSIS